MRSVVIPFKYASRDSIELRYTLRSIHKWIPDVEDVYLVGDDRPGWFFGVNIPYTHQNKFSGVVNVLHKLKAACEDPRITEDFIYSNDDFFLLAPFPDKRFKMKGSPMRQGGVHHFGYELTLDKLDELLCPYKWDYELHIPVVYNKSKALDLLRSVVRGLNEPYSFRTLYFNFYHEESEPLRDVKTMAFKPPVSGWCWSSGNEALNDAKFLKWMQDSYPGKSPWET